MSNGERNEGSEPLGHDEHGIPILNVRARLSEVERKAAEAEARDEKYKARQETINFRLMLFTGLLVLTSLITGGIAIWQARIANRNAKAAESAATTATQSVTKAQAAIDLSKAQFERQFNLTKSQFERDERPYIWKSKTEIPQVKLGEKLTWNIYYSNFGKSPAIGVLHRCQVRLAAHGEHGTPELRDMYHAIHVPGHYPGLVIPPGDSSNWTTCESEEIITQQDLDMMNHFDAGAKIVIFFEYFDTNGNIYTSTVCMFTRRQGQGPIGICPAENRIQ